MLGTYHACTLWSIPEITVFIEIYDRRLFSIDNLIFHENVEINCDAIFHAQFIGERCCSQDVNKLTSSAAIVDARRAATQQTNCIINM